MKIAIIGTGYVGLVAGTCFAESGNDVICVDNDETKLSLLNNGDSPIYEPGLSELLKKNIKGCRISFTSDIENAIKVSEIIFLALPTPQGENGSADLSYIIKVARVIGSVLGRDELAGCYKVIVDKSTVPVGTSYIVKQLIESQCPVCKFDVISNPEFLKEGVAINDFMKPDRVIIGSTSESAITLMKYLYAPFVRTGNPLLIMDEKSAELTKYAANSFLATKISFMNEMANLCDFVGADIEMVRKGMGTDSRIGHSFLFAGIGYGGSCFPKDVAALLKMSIDCGSELKIIKSVKEVNQIQKTVILNKVKQHFNGKLNGLTIALWGISFKPNTDDVREAPSMVIIQELLKEKVIIHVCDPEAMGKLGHLPVQCFTNAYDAIEGVDALILVTEWNDFRRPDFARMKSRMKQFVIFDGRNIYDPDIVKSFGFSYYGIGRK